MGTREFQGLVYIHADESCLGNQFDDRPAPGAAAGLLELFDETRGWVRRDYYVSEPDTTNNQMAIRSGIEGLRALKHACRVIFYSDSAYLVNGMTEWVYSWAKRGWRRKGGPIENLELWAELLRSAARHTIDWRWVRGHAGDPKNEYVNQLAVDAAQRQKRSRRLVESGFDSWLQEQQETHERFLDFLDLPPREPFSPVPKPPTPPLL